jgi:2-amino-4-hydroxy-6-hydroxymethyldihydropteridine diphosphokinase
MYDGIFLLLGSNQGEPDRNLAVARKGIESGIGRIIAASSLYKSAAWGVEDQPDFYNQVVRIASADNPEQVLEKALGIERRMGRVRKEKWGPRLIDIDLLFYDGQVRDTPALRLPHPGIPQRRFTLLPLAEIAPEFLHPVLNKSIATLLSACPDTLRVEKLN